MSDLITTCLWFDTEGEEAARFYCSVVPDSRITGIDRYPEGGPRPAGTALTVNFELGGRPYVALNGGPEFRFTEAVSFQIACADQDEVDHYWKALTDGGEESMCGWLKDRYGLSWQIVPDGLSDLLGDPDPGRAGRAMASMMTMRRIDIAEVRRAADAG
ncbi:MAG: VOC family protein [Nocardioidaceae bacterium]